jgi:hypothetical protein
MFVEKAIRFLYQVGNRFQGLIKGIQGLLPGSVEEKVKGQRGKIKAQKSEVKEQTVRREYEFACEVWGGAGADIGGFEDLDSS